MAERLCGRVVSWHPSQDKYGGSYGEIRMLSGRTVVWHAGQVYRDRTHMEVGITVFFEVDPLTSYAREISSKG